MLAKEPGEARMAFAHWVSCGNIWKELRWLSFGFSRQVNNHAESLLFVFRASDILVLLPDNRVKIDTNAENNQSETWQWKQSLRIVLIWEPSERPHLLLDRRCCKGGLRLREVYGRAKSLALRVSLANWTWCRCCDTLYAHCVLS